MATDCSNIYDSNGSLIVRDPLEETTRLSLIVENGEDGLSAYQIAVRNGFVGSEVEWLNSLKAPKSRYDILYSMQGPILPFESFPDILVVAAFDIPENFTGSGAFADQTSNVETIFDISKFDHTTGLTNRLGSLIFPPDTNLGTFSCNAVHFEPFDRLIIAARENPESTLADVCITFAANR